MNKKTIYIIILLLGLWLIGTKSYAGDGIYMIGSDGYNDGKLDKSHYAPQILEDKMKNTVKIKSVSSDKINVSNVINKKYKGNGIITLTNDTVTKKFGKDGVYQGDTIKLRFYVINDGSVGVNFNEKKGLKGNIEDSSNGYCSLNGEWEIVKSRKTSHEI